MRTVFIQREKKFWGSACIYMVLCDGKTVASIRNGQTVSFIIDDKEHIIQCQQTTPVNFYDGYGGGGTIFSDVVNVPVGNKDVKLFVSPQLASLKLELL